MLVLYPPVLENTARSISSNTIHATHITVGGQQIPVYDCPFQLPAAVDREDINHIQVSLKTVENAKPAMNINYAPDQATLFLDTRSATNDYFKFVIDDYNKSGIYHLYIPYKLFANGGPTAKTKYSLQVRFGTNALWTGVAANDWAEQNNAKTAFLNFAAWKKNSINHIPSYFGEWSNKQSVYCTGNCLLEITSWNVNDLVPELTWIYYDSDGINTLVNIECKITYKDNLARYISQTLVNNKIESDDAHNFYGTIKLPVAPLETIQCVLEATTVYNTILSDFVSIPKIQNNTQFDRSKVHELHDYKLSGEEQNDGALAKSYDFENLPGRTDIDCYSLYRVNLSDFKTLKITANSDYGLDGSVTGEVIFKDFSVEMGTPYLYVLMGYQGTYNKDEKTITNITKRYILSEYDPLNSTNSSYGRLMDFGASFLTTKQHQLRVVGDVKVSNFKRNVQDVFTATIGSKYPFYNRTAKQNYRTLSLSCLVSIQFDPTSTFLRFDGEGLWWDSNNGNQLIIWNEDLFSTKEISLSRKRFLTRHNDHASISSLEDNINIIESNDPLIDSTYYIGGPRTIFSDYLLKNSISNITTEQNGINIYAERQFRDKVMEWLSNGEPKLFRSETEGNLIVILSQVSFAPYESSNRMVYSMSCQMTEIAEPTLDNCILYNLLPTEFIATYKEVSPYSFTKGEKDPYIMNQLVFEDSQYLDIPLTQVGDKITNIETLPYIRGGSGDFTFSANGLPAGITIDPATGRISGTPILPNLATTATLTCTDNKTGYSQSVIINIGQIYNRLQWEDPLAPITAAKEGDVITPIKIIKPNNISGGYGQFKNYVFWLSNKVPGLDIQWSDADACWEIYGSMDAAIDAGTITVNCMDETKENIISTTINYNEISSKLRFNKLAEFDISATVVSEAITPIDFSVGVSGGKGPYQFSLAPGAPQGMNIDPLTGQLTFTPVTADICTGGNFTVFVTDNNGDMASVVCSYGTVYDQFVFDDIMAKSLPTMPLGTTLAPVDIFKNADGTYNVRGGVPYATEPYYRFSADNLEPDYTIDNYGIITGTALRTSVARTAMIYVRDSRGTIILQRPLNVGAITDSMTYKTTGITQIKVGSTSVNNNYTSYKKVENNTSSEVAGTSFTILAANFENAIDPTTLTCTEINLPFTFTKTRNNNDYVFTFNAPLASASAGRGYIQFSDVGGGVVNIPIEYGVVYQKLDFNGTITPIAESSVGQTIATRQFASIVGGQPFSDAPAGYRFLDDTNITQVLYNGTDTGLRIGIINSTIAVYGTPIISTPGVAQGTTFTQQVEIKDVLGDTILLTFSFNKIYDKLTLDFLGNDLHNQTWVIGNTVIPLLDDTAPGANYDTEIAKLKILKAAGGKTPYTYGVLGGFASPDMYLATLKETSTATDTVGVIQANNPLTVVSTTQKDYLNTNCFYVIDALGQQVFCEIGAGETWWNPKIINEINSIATALDLGYYYYGSPQTSTRLWNLQGLPTSAGANAWVELDKTMVPDILTSYRFIGGGEYFSFMSDSAIYPATPTSYALQGTLTAVRHAPDNTWTTDNTLNLTYGIRGFVDHLAVTKLTNLPAITINRNFTLQLGTNYTTNVASPYLNITEYEDLLHNKFPRGVSPYTWTFTGLPASVTWTPYGNGVYGTLSGQINSDITGQKLYVTVTDATGESVTKDLTWTAIVPMLTFNYVPALHDVPARAVGSLINDINYATATSNGQMPYNFTIAGIPTTYLSIGSTSGILKQTGNPAKQAATTLTLTITDQTINGSVTQIIQVGAIGDALVIKDENVTWSDATPINLTDNVTSYTGTLTFSPKTADPDQVILNKLKMVINADGTLTRTAMPYGEQYSSSSVDIIAADSLSSDEFALQIILPIGHDNLTWNRVTVTNNFDIDVMSCGSDSRSYILNGAIPATMNLTFDGGHIISKTDAAQPIGTGTINFTMTDDDSGTTRNFTVTVV